MAKDDGTIELDLDAPEPQKTEGAKKVETEVVSPSVDDAMEVLKRQLEQKDATISEGARRITQAEADAHQARVEAQKNATERRSAQLDMVKTAIETVKREQEMLEANLAAAYSQGDYGAVAKMQTQVATAAAKLLSLESGRDAMEAEAKQPVRPVTPPAQDPVEALASQLSPRSAAWVRAHPEYARDPRLTNRMIGAHNVVINGDDAPKVDSDEYFERVEAMLGVSKKAAPTTEVEVTDPLSEAAGATSRRTQAAPAAAPVTRSGTGNGQRPNRITLTKEEVEIAELNGMTPREYAEQKAKLIKEGKLH